MVKTISHHNQGNLTTWLSWPPWVQLMHSWSLMLVSKTMTASISHIHVHDKPLIKTIHHVVNVTTTEAKLFAIRCGISQATNIKDISKIIVITDLLHTAQKNFDYLSHPFQIHSVSILNELRKFFLQNWNNSIKFWECPNRCNWSLHKSVDRETKQFHPIPHFPCKMSWDFSKKSKCDDILFSWKMMFQASNLKGCHFLELCDDDNNPLEPSYAKGGTYSTLPWSYLVTLAMCYSSDLLYMHSLCCSHMSFF